MCLVRASNFILKEHARDNKPSSITPLVMVTTKKQYTFGFYTDLYFKNKTHHLESQLEYSKFPTDLYNSATEKDESYTPLFFNATGIYSISFQDKFFVGAMYQYRHFTLDKFENNGLISSLYNPDHKHLSGFGLTTRYDSRNHFFQPSEGMHTSFSIANYGEVIGSGSSFSTYAFNHRHYMKSFWNTVFAYQSFVFLKYGDVPFYELNRLGGEQHLRGYESSRYYGKHKFAQQFEFRKNVYYTLDAAIYAGFGNVTNQTEDLFSDFKPMFGFGVRYHLDAKNKIPLRIDFAFGEGSSGFYISLMEAF